MKVDWNKKYLTISIYTIVVFTVCSIILKFSLSWTDTYGFISKIISVLSPFLLGILIAYFINELVIFFEEKVVTKIKIGRFSIKSKKSKRSLAIFLSYLVFLGFIVIIGAIIVPQLYNSVSDIISSIPDALAHWSQVLSNISISFGGMSYSLDMTYLNEYINENFLSILENPEGATSTASSLLVNIFNMTKNLASTVANIFIAIVVSIYLLMSKELVGIKSKKIVVAFFSPKMTQSLLETAEYAHNVFTSFFVGKLIDSLIIGILCFIILIIARIPYALLLSVMVGVTNIIPYFGPFIGGIIGFILLILINPVKALWFLLIIIILQQFDGNILAPKILGDSIGLSPFWVIFAIIIFGSMFGFMGMFLGAPLLSVIKRIIDKSIEAKYIKKTTINLDYINHDYEQEP